MNLSSRLFREPHTGSLLFASIVLTSFLAGGLAILQSFQLSGVISQVFLEGKSLIDVLPVLRMILFIVLARAVFILLNDGLAGKLAVAIKTRLRNLLLQKIDRLGPEFLKNETTGELTTTALQGVDALDAYFSQYLPQVILAAILPLTILIVVFPLDTLSGIVFLLTAPLIPIFMILIGKSVQTQTSHQWRALTQLGVYFLDTLQGLATLKALGQSQKRTLEVRETSDQYRVITMNVLRITFLTALVLELVATLSTAVVAVEIGLRLLYGRIEFQQAFFILLIAPDFYLPMRTLSLRYHAGMTGVTAAEKIYQLLDTPERKIDLPASKHNLATLMEGDYQLEVRDLSLTYSGQATAALNQISFSLNKGKHYALVGPSGSGKSSLARLLLRFIEPDGGQILLNSEDIHAWSKEEWRRLVGWIPQKPALLNDSLINNITLGMDCFSQVDLAQAIEAAGLFDLIARLPEGGRTPLLESGYRFSGGEIQRIALARGVLRNPRLIVMDEPMEHLDPEGSEALSRSFSDFMHGKTSITIAHRLSTILHADEIIFLQSGQLMGFGTHSHLLETCPEYRSFVFPVGGEK